MFYDHTVAVLQAEILQKNEQREHQVELLKLKKKGRGVTFFFFFSKGTGITPEFIWAEYTTMPVYFSSGTVSNSAFIIQ